MSEVVRLERHDAVAIVTVDSPPVNALSAAVRGGILECMKDAVADSGVKAIVLTCAGRTFIAGADITEFGKPPKPPGLTRCCSDRKHPEADRCRDSRHGAWRRSRSGAGLSLPRRDPGRKTRSARGETRPAAGRRRNAAAAARGWARACGQDDRRRRSDQRGGCAEEWPDRGNRRAPAAGGEAFARKVLAETRPLRKLRDDDSKLAAAKADRSIFTNAVAAMTKRARGLEAPFAAADAVGAAIDLPFDEGLKKEREGFLKLVASDQSKAQRYAFFSGARGRQDFRRARRDKAAQGRAGRHHRRRHHGRRHCDVVRQCRHPGYADRDRRGAAQAWHGRDAEELPCLGRARRHSGGRAGQAHGADQWRGRPRKCWGCRPRHRSRVRDHGREEGSVHARSTSSPRRARCSPPTPRT